MSEGPPRPPLAALERLRGQEVEEARAALVAAAGEAARERAALERETAALRELGERLRSTGDVPARAAAAELSALESWSARLRREEERGRQACARREEAVRRATSREEARRAALAQAERERRAVERHRESWAEERRRAREAAEEARQEELGASRPAHDHGGRPWPGRSPRT